MTRQKFCLKMVELLLMKQQPDNQKAYQNTKALVGCQTCKIFFQEN